MFRIDRQLAIARYRWLSTRYDYASRRIEPVRKQTIDALCLERGQRVLDVACGTGKSFVMLRFMKVAGTMCSSSNLPSSRPI